MRRKKIKSRLPKPYASGEKWILYCGDCLDLLPRLQPLDLIVTDPPYGIGLKYGDGSDDSPDRHWEWFRPVLAAMRSASPQVIFTHRQEAVRHLTDWDHLCVWHKPFSFAYSIKGWQPKWEPIFVYGGIVTSTYGGGSRPVRHDSWVLNVSTSRKRFGHPTEKPLDLFVDIVRTFSGDVCDPFCGSGTTGVAALQLGRRFIGIEIEEQYCEIAAKRLREAEHGGLVEAYNRRANQSGKKGLFQ